VKPNGIHTKREFEMAQEPEERPKTDKEIEEDFLAAIIRAKPQESPEDLGEILASIRGKAREAGRDIPVGGMGGVPIGAEQDVLSAAVDAAMSARPQVAPTASTFVFSDDVMRAVNDIARLQANDVSQAITPTEKETSAAVAKAIGTYRLLLAEVASGGVVLVRRRNRSTYAVNLK
jgi:hypothetical protein